MISQGEIEEYGILIFVPGHIPSDNKADRRSTRISGFILGVFSINKFVEAALGGAVSGSDSEYNRGIGGGKTARPGLCGGHWVTDVSTARASK